LVTTRQPDGTGLALAIDPAKLSAAVGDAAAGFATAPVDAKFAVTGAGVTIIPSQDGAALDFAALGAPIVAGQRQIEAPLAPVTPAHNTQWAQNLGIKEVVSSFTTNHPCCASRVTNIHRAADLMQDTVLEPGQVFSLNDTIGPRTTARGFVEAPVYYQGFTTDVGGGVSQLSTTVFNAAWWGGFDIVEHQPHSIWITRYPPGREATLNYGTIDNKFRNNSQHGVLVHTSYTGTSITVTIFGDKEGKVVREENREVTSGVQAAGARFVVEFDRVIDQPGQPQIRQHYKWTYKEAPPE
jgi:vancomycin resistance protein YoaR